MQKNQNTTEGKLTPQDLWHIYEVDKNSYKLNRTIYFTNEGAFCTTKQEAIEDSLDGSYRTVRKQKINPVLYTNMTKTDQEDVEEFLKYFTDKNVTVNDVCGVFNSKGILLYVCLILDFLKDLSDGYICKEGK